MMLTYIQVHLYFVIPPILLLAALYHPVLGRRDAVKILWLVFMATAWTTPWDNFIIANGGWTYPPSTIVGKIGHVPLEEHLFFILQPIFIVLLHCIFTHSELLPFRTDPTLLRLTPWSADFPANGTGNGNSNGDEDGVEITVEKTVSTRSRSRFSVQTLPRRPFAALFWVVIGTIGVVLAYNAHVAPSNAVFGETLDFGQRGFYLGWILAWISPVIGGLSWLGARSGRRGWMAWAVGSAWLCLVDTIAIRSGAWSISLGTSLNLHVWRGLPIEECIFFLLTTHLLIIASSLMSHLHTLLLLHPSLPVCPPSNIVAHVRLLARTALERPEIDQSTLIGLVEAEETLKKGSKSFDVAKLAFGREMRIGLIAVYAWCRTTDNLIDDIHLSIKNADPETVQHEKVKTLNAIRRHLATAYHWHGEGSKRPYGKIGCNEILDSIPHLTASDRAAFTLFHNLVPRLVPIEPFVELCEGYATDLKFMPGYSQKRLQTCILNGEPIDEILPIRTQADLMQYADDVAGSIASAICYLSWSILSESPENSTEPVKDLNWVKAIHSATASTSNCDTAEKHIPPASQITRVLVVEKAREMGRALQLVNIARDVAKDAIIGRVYIPLSFFATAKDLLAILLAPSQSQSQSQSTMEGAVTYAPYTTRLLDMADDMRRSSERAMSRLPRTARGGARAMAASYFEIAHEIRRRGGEVGVAGVKVSKWRRLKAAAQAMWVG